MEEKIVTRYSLYLPSSDPYTTLIQSVFSVCCMLLFTPIHRPLVIPLTPPLTLERLVATIHRTHTRKPFARRHRAPPPIRTRRVRRRPPRPIRRLRNVATVAAPVATRTIPSAPPPPAVDRAATATARPLPAGCPMEPPTDTTPTVSKPFRHA